MAEKKKEGKSKRGFLGGLLGGGCCCNIKIVPKDEVNNQDKSDEAQKK
ncbi:hypothetical protein SAMN00808754_1735 [Thermanaeromonas toyohensis ToBE]|uniref:Uncharacterized protein n=1 Tax=Thermanaeromonas toyohensis ToBE TaxID=698762 RepID=A0A1W1VUI1_9FIRM|nr:hypothetical protein [Thermanaeromonas toyohensis]SMB97009.1 hypothetical protein SAMN00808754_1735 [Thermanaeromonas toyohensis ToBE]